MVSGAMKRAKHIAAQFGVVALISATSILAYHAWWRFRWHHVFRERFALQSRMLQAKASSAPDPSPVDWLSVVLNAEKLTEPLLPAAAAIWLENKRRKMAPVKSGENKISGEPGEH